MICVPTGAGATKLVLLSIVVVCRTLGQVDDRAGGAERVGEGHDGAAMQDRRAGAEIVAHRHASATILSAEALTNSMPSKVAKGSSSSCDPLENFHSIVLSR